MHTGEIAEHIFEEFHVRIKGLNRYAVGGGAAVVSA